MGEGMCASKWEQSSKALVKCNECSGRNVNWLQLIAIAHEQLQISASQKEVGNG